MNWHAFSFAGAALVLRASGALWWPAERVLCVADLHLGKTERVARRRGAMLPPYETEDTLRRLGDEIRSTDPETVVCLGDSFDDNAAAEALGAEEAHRIAALGAGRAWVWVAGNHDPGPLGLAGEQLAELQLGPLLFRHVALSDAPAGEVSGHYHPKAGLALGGVRISRPCALYDRRRIVLPAFGTYTGGLSWTDPALRALFAGPTCAVLTGPVAHAVRVPDIRRAARPRRVPAAGRSRAMRKQTSSNGRT